MSDIAQSENWLEPIFSFVYTSSKMYATQNQIHAELTMIETMFVVK